MKTIELDIFAATYVVGYDTAADGGVHLYGIRPIVPGTSDLSLSRIEPPSLAFTIETEVARLNAQLASAA